jgi:hypothetical protein
MNLKPELRKESEKIRGILGSDISGLLREKRARLPIQSKPELKENLVLDILEGKSVNDYSRLHKDSTYLVREISNQSLETQIEFEKICKEYEGVARDSPSFDALRDRLKIMLPLVEGKVSELESLVGNQKVETLLDALSLKLDYFTLHQEQFLDLRYINYAIKERPDLSLEKTDFLKRAMHLYAAEFRLSENINRYSFTRQNKVLCVENLPESIKQPYYLLTLEDSNGNYELCTINFTPHTVSVSYHKFDNKFEMQEIILKIKSNIPKESISLEFYAKISETTN